MRIRTPAYLLAALCIAGAFAWPPADAAQTGLGDANGFPFFFLQATASALLASAVRLSAHRVRDGVLGAILWTLPAIRLSFDQIVDVLLIATLLLPIAAVLLALAWPKRSGEPFGMKRGETRKPLDGLQTASLFYLGAGLCHGLMNVSDPLTWGWNHVFTGSFFLLVSAGWLRSFWFRKTSAFSLGIAWVLTVCRFFDLFVLYSAAAFACVFAAGWIGRGLIRTRPARQPAHPAW